MTAPVEALGEYLPCKVDQALALLDRKDMETTLGSLADMSVPSKTIALYLSRWTGLMVRVDEVMDYRLEFTRNSKLFAEWREQIEKEDEGKK